MSEKMSEGRKKKKEEMGYRWYKTFCRMIEQIPRAENGSGSVNGGSGGRVFFHGGSQSSVLSDPK